MPYPGHPLKAIPFISGPSRVIAKWLPTVLVASVSAWGVVNMTPSRVTLLEPSAARSVRETGRRYTKGLATVYAAAWLEGAEALESGRGIAESLGVVEKAWKAGRTSLFDRQVAPYFSAIVPEGRPDAETSQSARAALAKLWREFAAGLASVE